MELVFELFCVFAFMCQALAEVEGAKKQLLLLDAEAQGARIKKAAVDEAAEGLAASSSRQAAALEEQRAALGELLRQLEAREDAVSQVMPRAVWGSRSAGGVARERVLWPCRGSNGQRMFSFRSMGKWF
jgi:hypothetical protein